MGVDRLSRLRQEASQPLTSRLRILMSSLWSVWRAIGARALPRGIIDECPQRRAQAGRA